MPGKLQNQDHIKEISRLIGNQKSLLDNMAEVVLLINENKTVEYTNKSADTFFDQLITSDKSSKNNEEALQKIYDTISQAVREALQNPNRTGLEKAVINDVHIEFTIAPFVGYKGDQLFWLVIYDVTERKNKEEEISHFHKNIESIISNKIQDLNESERIRKQLSKQVNTLKYHLKTKFSDNQIVGSSQVMHSVKEMAIQVASSNATILLTGESGTGKELIANLIHRTSDRRDKPFLKINCNAINESLLESDLFGYEKGAFTGATTQRKGKFEVVDGGTLLLDEVGDISGRMQAILLRTLQNGEIMRVGGTEPIRVDVRIIAATNMDLAKAVQKGSFRLDLYYRLNIINIALPPLKERKEDIIELVAYFVKKYREAFNKNVDFVPKTIINKLLEHDWPGNVRELQNVIQRAILVSTNNIISEQDLQFDVHPENGLTVNLSSLLENKQHLPLKDILATLEKKIITNVLKENNGNVALAAQSLQVGKTAFYDKMKKYDISPKSF